MTLAEFFETHRSPKAIVLPAGGRHRLRPLHPTLRGIDFGRAGGFSQFGAGRRSFSRMRDDRAAVKKK